MSDIRGSFAFCLPLRPRARSCGLVEKYFDRGDLREVVDGREEREMEAFRND